jgi:hypothetical protein
MEVADHLTPAAQPSAATPGVKGAPRRITVKRARSPVGAPGPGARLCRAPLAAIASRRPDFRPSGARARGRG